jgi:ubiquitin conjugation factor E4 B
MIHCRSDEINADQHASDAFYSKKVEGTSNFITEIFFLTVAAHHYGSESLTSKMEQLEKDVRHMAPSLTSMIHCRSDELRQSGKIFQ